MQAVILVGGEGTRLRPLTSTVPKPVVPLVDRPFIVYMLEWLRGHGVDDVIMSCGFLATGVRNVLGDGSQLRHPPALRRGARAARHRRRAEVRRGPARRALPHAQRRRPHRPRPQRADRPARGDRRGRHARARAGRRTRRATASCACTTTARSRSSSRSRRPTSDRHEPHLRRRLRARALGARPDPARPQRLDRARGLARARRRRASTASPTTAYWIDIGTPERYLQATFDILEGNVATAVAERLGDGFLAVDAAAQVDGRVVPPAVVERGATIAAGAHVGSLAVLGEGVSVGAGSIVERCVVLHGAEIGADCVLRDCIVAAGARIGDRHAGRRRRDARRGRDGRAPTTSSRAARECSPAWRYPMAASPSERSTVQHEQLELDRERSAGRHVRPAHRHRRPARAPARRAVEGRVRAAWSRGTRPAASSSPAWAARRSAASLARAMLGDHASRPILAVARVRPAGVDDARHDRPVRVLLGQHRGDARLLRGRRARSARGASSSRAAASSPSSRAPTACPVIPVAGGFQPRAAVAYMTVAALEVAALCGAGPRMGSEIDVAADHLEQLVVEWGPEGAEDSQAKTLARALHGSVPVDRRRRADARRSPTAGRRQINENAKIPAFAHELPELDHNEIVGWRARPRSGASPRSSSTTPTRIRASRSASTLTARAHRAHGAAGTHRRRVARPHGRRARLLARAARRPRVALRRGAARRRPEPVDVLDRLKAELAGAE